MSNNIIEIKNLKKSFGGLKAVDIENLNLEKNKIISLIGPNGAGKTTFFDLITGFTKQDSGNTLFNGKNISNLESYKISRLGMVRTFQLTKVFDRMTVNENILFSASSLKNDRFISSLFKSSLKSKIEKELNEKTNEVLNMVNLYHMKDSYARELSGGQKKLLELARVIIQKPKLLLLDEPLAGVNPKLSEDILSLINTFVEEGVSVLMVEHNISAVMKVSDHIIVLAEGSVIAEGSSDEIRTNENVVSAYLGRSNE
tara:strand:+ start:2547 stop:3317 length:771 start_codon:yes stop_codon:yes gene_type:complete